MNPNAKKIAKSSNNSPSSANNSSNNNNNNNFPRKPRRSIKAEGNCLNSMLRDGCAKVIDASKLGKRLSSEIWNSFGAIQVEDNFTYPSIDTKTVADGSATLKICQFFVACSRCFSVFKYDGHAYGTTGLVKHVKICQGGQQRLAGSNFSTLAGPNPSGAEHTTQSVPGSQPVGITLLPNSNTQLTANTTTLNGPVAGSRRRAPATSRARNAAASQPSLRHLAKVIEELRCEQTELKQKLLELINMIGSGYVIQTQIIGNDGDKVDDELQKTD